jgi:hypothetical protein
MPEIGGKIAGSGYNLFDWLAVGVCKRVTEVALTPIVSNGSYMSGGVKIGAAIVGDMVRPKSGTMGKVGEYIIAGLVIDGVEDITLNLLGANPFGLMGKSSSDSVQYV